MSAPRAFERIDGVKTLAREVESIEVGDDHVPAPAKRRKYRVTKYVIKKPGKKPVRSP